LDTLYSNFPGGFEKKEDKVLVIEKEKRKLVRKLGGKRLG
jgi:hypothetical protein